MHIHSFSQSNTQRQQWNINRYKAGDIFDLSHHKRATENQYLEKLVSLGTIGALWSFIRVSDRVIEVFEAPKCHQQINLQFHQRTIYKAK